MHSSGPGRFSDRTSESRASANRDQHVPKAGAAVIGDMKPRFKHVVLGTQQDAHSKRLDHPWATS